MVDEKTGDLKFVHGVRLGLTAQPKSLSPIFFYDALGSHLFDAICELPWYPITRAETEQLQHHADTIAAAWPMPVRLVELGSGDGSKIAILAQAFARSQSQITVELIDISESALQTARKRLEQIPGCRVRCHAMDYASGLQSAFEQAEGFHSLVLFLGSNLGNFRPTEARELLGRIKSVLQPGDAILLGVDLVKPVEQMTLAYDDPMGVTAAFNKNLLTRMNRELAANFDLRQFAHRAIWNAEHSRMEMYLVSLRAQTVQIPGADLTVHFEADEAILTEHSYKFTPAAIHSLVEQAGLQLSAEWRHEGGFLNAIYRNSRS